MEYIIYMCPQSKCFKLCNFHRTCSTIDIEKKEFVLAKLLFVDAIFFLICRCFFQMKISKIVIIERDLHVDFFNWFDYQLVESFNNSNNNLKVI